MDMCSSTARSLFILIVGGVFISSGGEASSSLIPSVLVPWYAAGLGSLHRFDCRLGYQGIQGEVSLARWFKDDQEFYRFKARSSPRTEVFHVPGVHVDIDESGATVVALYDVDGSTSGRYKCLLSSVDENPALTAEFEITVEHPNDTLFRSVTVRQRVPINSTVESNATSASINCFVDLRPGKIYSFSWYKDDQEFYRLVPWNANQTQSVFQVDGVHVDLERSSGKDVTLIDVGTNSTGLYKCVASTAATITGAKRSLVHRVLLEF